MNNYSENNVYFYRMNLSLIGYETLLLEKKTPLSHAKETISLAALSPETKVVKKGLSFLARFLLIIELIIIVGLHVFFFRYPDCFTNMNLPFSIGIIVFFISLSLFYYICETKSRIYFYYNQGQLAFSLPHYKNNIKQMNWINAFHTAVRQARVNAEQANFIKIAKGIDSLKKQKLINQLFAEELHNRLSLLANTTIK